MYKYRLHQASYQTYAVHLLAICLLLGALYYLGFRPLSAQPWPLAQLGFELHWNDSVTHGSFPSLAHALATFIAILAWLRVTGASNAATLLWVAATLFMLLAGEWFLGTFSIVDALMVLLALPMARFLTNRGLPLVKTNHVVGYKKGVIACILSFFSLLSVACYYDGYGLGECARYDNEGNCVERVIYADPVYMSYNELRSSVRQEAVRPLDDVGRIYAYENYLFINERNKGIHVFDNADAFNPKPLSFIAIPGNLDIEIRGDRLYADSFIDLITLDVSNTAEVSVIDRQQDVFIWDAEQNIPYNVRLNFSQIDRTQGVVIGYQE